MDRITFGQKSSNRQGLQADRFVRSRAEVGEMRKRRHLETEPRKDREEVIWYVKHLRHKGYMSQLHSVFGLESCRDSCGLQFWPCVPRKKRFLSSADSVLDLPYYSVSPFPDLLDWNKDFTLVASLGGRYHKWSWHTQSIIGIGVTFHAIQVCKFDPRGEILLLGTEMGTVELHDHISNKWLLLSQCPCQSICSITAIDWSPTGNSFVVGCSHGALTSFTRNAKRITTSCLTTACISTLKIAPNARFVAAVTTESPSVRVVSWPDLKLYSSLSLENEVKTIAWHPWRSALLAVGGMSAGLQPRLVLWDAPTSATRQATLSATQQSLDTMLFSNTTGELVVNLWSPGEVTLPEVTGTHLIVLSDPYTVVDQWCRVTHHTVTDRVRTMVFSPDETKLATATSEEDLVIWNFLPESKQVRNKRRFSALPVFLDQASDGYSIR